MKLFLIFIISIFTCMQFSFAQTYSLVWADSFNGNTINTNNWKHEIGSGGWGNNELQHYTNSTNNSVVQNGTLQIIAKKEVLQGSNYTSARLISKNLQSWKYGKIEARIKLQQTQGVWPAFWMLGANIDQVGWPQCGEIDILEHINTENKIYGTMHWNNNGAVNYGASTFCNATQYHTYGIEWDADNIKWYLDNVLYHSGNIKNNINNTAAFQEPFFMILNMAVGGNWPGSPAVNSIFPDTMFVDYINVFQKTYPTAVAEIKSTVNGLVYPNPASDVIQVNSKNYKNATIQIIDVFGKIRIEKVLDNFAINTLSIKNIPSGIYYYFISSENENIHKGTFIKK